MSERWERLWALVRCVPPGRVVGYAQVGREFDPPISGLLVGKWMSSVPPDVPWWRVIGADGALKTLRAGAHVAATQQRLLEEEGVTFAEGRVPTAYFWAYPDR